MNKTNDFLLAPSQLSSPLLKKLFPEIEKTAIQKSMESQTTPSKYKNIYTLAASRDASAALLSESSKKAPPITNRGVSHSGLNDTTEFNWMDSFDSLETKEIKAIGRGKSTFVTIPKKDTSHNFKYSFIDYLNFTFHVDDFNYKGVSNEDIVISLGIDLNRIFGYGVTSKRENGLNFYKESYDLGINGWGTVCIGGQNDTVLVTLKGQGLMAAEDKWPLKLYNFLSSIRSASITRVDLAHDSFSSNVSVDDYLEMYKSGLFTNRGQLPNVEQAGNWINPDGKGRTLYVGSRSSGKLLRIYEKGLQLARGYSQLFPSWIRAEVELRNDGRVIPLDVLKNPSQYLSGMYPALKRISVVQNYFETKKKTAVATVATALEITKTQFGKYIWVFKELYGLERAFEMLTKGKEQAPDKLDLQSHSTFDPVLNLSPQRAITFEEIII